MSLAFTRHVTQHSNPQPYGLVWDLHIKCNDTVCSQKEWVKLTKGNTWASWHILQWRWFGVPFKTAASIKLLTWLTDGCAGNVQCSFNFSSLRHQKQAAISLCEGEEGGMEARSSIWFLQLWRVQHYCQLLRQIEPIVKQTGGCINSSHHLLCFWNPTGCESSQAIDIYVPLHNCSNTGMIISLQLQHFYLKNVFTDSHFQLFFTWPIFS